MNQVLARRPPLPWVAPGSVFALLAILAAALQPLLLLAAGGAVALGAALALAACGAGSDPLAEPSTETGESGGTAGAIIVGSADFTESQILGELYAQAIKAKGGDASTKPGIGSREVYIKALQDNSVSVVPEYTGNLLLHFDPAATATTEAEIASALPSARR